MMPKVNLAKRKQDFRMGNYDSCLENNSQRKQEFRMGDFDSCFRKEQSL